ncbi:alpha-L-arabinofuranosidase C-terminal domain-containing protein [Halococcus sp. IIIV-5B]|uniref:alpha-L-arabinofuranosidase C-terminal domain-containing protein n=1 Tax=Halococcus sp. IIIV-5B TaxID=2321230 RepID=UPI000E7083C9|nr:alpha-L-arabinofuranosidase C-terminal domain-containing protein [Halococcus sp. IIIV-5B]RJT06810.1 hypothetical protein D3261_04680 [Halococcus sp. IIIV-5B]
MTVMLAGRISVGLGLSCGTISTETIFGGIRPVDGVPTLDAMAVVDDDASELVVILIDRRSGGAPVEVTIDTGTFDPDATASVTTLSGETMYVANTHDRPDRVTSVESTATFDDDLTLDLNPYSMTRVVIPHADRLSK